MKPWSRSRHPIPVLSFLVSVAAGTAAAAPKVTICHFPPGNPASVQLLSVSAPAVPAHLTLHNDAVCPAGDSNCCFGGANPSVCTNFQTDAANCGACGTVCNLANATAACSGGACTIAACAPGFADCNGSAADGCETALDTTANCGACGNACATGASCTDGACTCPGTETLCDGACTDTSSDDDNCGACGIVCASGQSCSDGSCGGCASGELTCAGACVNPLSDPNNCGSCGTACAAGSTCVGGTCASTEVAASCLPTSSLSVLIQGTAPAATATAYVPLGDWSSPVAGVIAVPIEPPGAATLIGTPNPVNSCSSNGVTGLTVCTGNGTDVYVISGTTLSSSLTDGAAGTQTFSGGACMTCGVATDAGTGLSWLTQGASIGGQIQSLDPASSTFGAPIGFFGLQTSENPAVDPIRHRVWAAGEDGTITGVDTITNTVFQSAFTTGLTNDATALDCNTNILATPGEFSQNVVLVDLSQAIFTPGAPGSFSAPFNSQNFPDFTNMVAAGASGIAIAPGSHLAVVTDEFGGAGFGVIELPATSGSGIPAAVDFAAANLPADPSGTPWSMGLDPHTVTAYTSPNSGRSFAVISNLSRSFLALVDMHALLVAPRLPATHTVDPSVDLVGTGVVTFIAE